MRFENTLSIGDYLRKRERTYTTDKNSSPILCSPATMRALLWTGYLDAIGIIPPHAHLGREM
jgi:hypothetical protein